MILIDEINALGCYRSTHGVSYQNNGLIWELSSDVFDNFDCLLYQVCNSKLSLVVAIMTSVASEVKRYTH
jgi:hypothetical protein